MFRRCRCEDWPCCGHGYEDEEPFDDINIAELHGDLMASYNDDEVLDEKELVG